MAATTEQKEFQTVVEGEWTASSCGGLATSPRWKNNPQFNLVIKEETDVTIVLTQVLQGGADGAVIPIGFYLAKRHRGSKRLGRILKFGRQEFVATSQFATQESAMVELKLSPTSDPYVVIPATPQIGHRGRFTLRVESSRPVSLAPIDPYQDWELSTVRGQWSQGSSGGCRHHRSWRQNPQFKLFVPKTTSMTISLQLDTQKDIPDCGFYVSRASDLSGLKKLTLSDDEIVSKSRFAGVPEVSQEMLLQGSDSPYIIIVATREPDVRERFTLSVFSDQSVRLEPISESQKWRELLVTGDVGMRRNPPRFKLQLKDQDEVTTVLPMISQHNTSESDTLAPIGVSVLGPGDAPVTRSNVSASWEVSTSAALNPKNGPFIIEPTVQDTQTHSSFSLVVYSDREVSVSPEPSE